MALKKNHNETKEEILKTFEKRKRIYFFSFITFFLILVLILIVPETISIKSLAIAFLRALGITSLCFLLIASSINSYTLNLRFDAIGNIYVFKFRRSPILIEIENLDYCEFVSPIGTVSTLRKMKFFFRGKPIIQLNYGPLASAEELLFEHLKEKKIPIKIKGELSKRYIELLGKNNSTTV